MSATLPEPPVASEKLDPFRYGWRYVTRKNLDGKSKVEMIPLTLEDALHPQEEDRYMITDAHTRDTIYLRDVFEAQLADRAGTVVLHDCRVAWSADGKYAHGP